MSTIASLPTHATNKVYQPAGGDIGALETIIRNNDAYLYSWDGIKLVVRCALEFMHSNLCFPDTLIVRLFEDSELFIATGKRKTSLAGWKAIYEKEKFYNRDDQIVYPKLSLPKIRDWIRQKNGLLDLANIIVLLYGGYYREDFNS